MKSESSHTTTVPLDKGQRKETQSQNQPRKRKPQGQQLDKSSKPRPEPKEPRQYWIPREEIAWEVISTDIQVYLPGASARQEERNGKPGYLVDASEVPMEELRSMLSDLKADTLRWQAEGAVYETSEVKSTTGKGPGPNFSDNYSSAEARNRC